MSIKKTSNPKVSVLMPIYNTPCKILKESIESILTQTYTDFEFLIINDSPKNKKLDKIVESFKDQRIVYLKNKKNIGLEESTNKLLDIAKGKYIAIFDHDDISLPNRLKLEVDYLDKNHNIGCVSGQFEVFGTENWVSKNPEENDEIKKTMISESCISHTASMFRANILKKNNIKYEKEFFPAASYRILSRIVLVSDVYNLPDILVKYRMSKNNTSIKFAEQRIISRKKIRKEYKDKYYENKIKSIFNLDKISLIKNSIHGDNAQRYYKGIKKNSEFFIKFDKYNFSNEYNMAKKAHAHNARFFINPIKYYTDEKNQEYGVIYKYFDGIQLDNYINQNNLDKDQRKKIIDQLYNIVLDLKKINIVHRDIIPRNILVDKNNNVKLIDFNLAVERTSGFEYNELPRVANDIFLFSKIGEEYSVGNWAWNDAFSIIKIIKGIECKDNVILPNEIKEMLGDIIIPNKNIINNAIIKKDEQLQAKDEQLQAKDEQLQAKDEQLQLLRNSFTYKVGSVILLPLKIVNKLLCKLKYSK